MSIHEIPHESQIVPDVIPTEWVDELRMYDRRSHDFKVLADSLGELAAGQGIELDIDSLLDDEHQKLAPPDGFASMEVLPDYKAQIPTDQFAGRIEPLALYPEPEIETEVIELITDTGFAVRVCDLRPFMPKSVQKNGPTDHSEVERLDDKLYRDLHLYAEIGQARNMVADVDGIAYTKVGGTKIRAYWTSVKDETNTTGISTVARLADTSNSRTAERDVYRRVLGWKHPTNNMF